MTIKYHPDLIQGSDEWLSARIGLLTASEMKHIITPETNKPASNDKEKSHVYEILSQRITGYVEPHYVGDDMLRGIADEVEARILYEKHFSPVTECGFITNNKWGFTIGYSPDGLVGEDGAIECKSRRQKFQIESILSGEIPTEYSLQIQTGLLVSEREWIDFVSYSAGLPMMTRRIYPREDVQKVIVEAATIFYEKIDTMLCGYQIRLEAEKTLIPTERRKEEEISV